MHNRTGGSMGPSTTKLCPVFSYQIAGPRAQNYSLQDTCAVNAANES